MFLRNCRPMLSTKISEQERPLGKRMPWDPGKRNEGHLWVDGDTSKGIHTFRRNGANG